MRNHPLRRALRLFDVFTRSSANPTSLYDNPYTGQIGKAMSGPRVF